MSIVRRRLAAAHRELRSLAGDPDRWVGSPVGRDLSVDGWVAIDSADSALFVRFVDAFTDFCRREGAPVRSLDAQGPAALLARFDPFLEACAEIGPNAFWPGLAVGLTLVQALGGPPRIESSEATVIGDSLLLVASPSYRALRFAAYNAGVRTLCMDQPKAPAFRPEFGHLLITSRELVRQDPACVPFITVNHDLAHIVLFGDAYLRPAGTPAMTASLLLNAEETSCGLDLVLTRDLARFGVELRALQDLLALEAGSREGRDSLTRRAAEDREGFVTYQAALRAAAQAHLAVPNPVSERIGEGVPIPADLADWFHPETQRTHAAWNEKLAERVWHPVFQRFVSLLPPLAGHGENLHRYTREIWEAGQPVLDRIDEPCPVSRARGLLEYRLRFLVIRAAELAVRCDESGGFSTALADDLTRWALRVVEDYVRIRRQGASPEAAERCEAHARGARALIGRYPGLDGPESLAALFDDPVARFSRAAAPVPAGKGIGAGARAGQGSG